MTSNGYFSQRLQTPEFCDNHSTMVVEFHKIVPTSPLKGLLSYIIWFISQTEVEISVVYVSISIDIGKGLASDTCRQ